MSCGKTIALLCAILGATVLLGQLPLNAPNSTPALEFPVLMEQNVEAGKTSVGTKIKARLAVSTLDHGTVIPKDAILFGEVIESAAKSVTAPSRLAIRADSAQWNKKGSPSIVLALPPGVYLTAWCYLSETPALLDYPESAPPWTQRNEGPVLTNPDTPGPTWQRPLPRNAEGTTGPVPPALSTTISLHRVLMKNVESMRGRDQSVTLTSARSNIKLDKFTTYVLAAGDLLPPKTN